MSEKNNTNHNQQYTGTRKGPNAKGPQEIVMKAGKERKPC